MQNIALNKPALQSSVSRWSVHPRPADDAAIANNGDTRSKLCCQTANEREPWWQVDLGDLFLLQRVTIHNRLKQSDRLRNFSILRSCDGVDWFECGRRAGKKGFEEATLVLQGENVARFLRVRLTGSGVLHFRECEVFGEGCSPADVARLLEADRDLLRRRKLVPEGRSGEIVELGGFFVFVDDAYGPNVQAALRNGGYESIERELTAEFVRPGDRVLEAGTAVGVVAMTAAAIVGPGSVMSFDANPNMIEDARRNFARNNMAGITALHGLLVNRGEFEPGATAKFGIAEEFWGSRLGDLDADDIKDIVETPIHCLEERIEAFGANVLICDIEGAEVDLLAEADLSMLRLIILETHYWARGEAATDGMIAKLIQRGFAIHLGVSRHNVVVMRRHGASM